MMPTSPVLAYANVTPPRRSAIVQKAHAIAARLPSGEAVVVCGLLASCAFASPVIGTALGGASSYCFRVRRLSGNPRRLRLMRARSRAACATIGLWLLFGSVNNLIINDATPRSLLYNEFVYQEAKRYWDAHLSPAVVARKYIAPAFGSH